MAELKVQELVDCIYFQNGKTNCKMYRYTGINTMNNRQYTLKTLKIVSYRAVLDS